MAKQSEKQTPEMLCSELKVIKNLIAQIIKPKKEQGEINNGKDQPAKGNNDHQAVIFKLTRATYEETVTQATAAE